MWVLGFRVFLFFCLFVFLGSGSRDEGGWNPGNSQ